MESVGFKRPDGNPIQIEIIRLEAGEGSRDRHEERHRHDFHSILYIDRGQSEQEIDFEEYSIGPNQVAVIPTKSIHWEKKRTPLKGFVIVFKDEFFSLVQKELLNGFLQYAIATRKLVIPVPPAGKDNLLRYFQLLYEEQAQGNHQNQIFLLQNLMLALLNKLEALSQQQHLPPSFIKQRSLFQKFISLVEEKYSSQKTLSFYVTHLQTTSRKLNKVLKETIGQTAQDFIIDRVLLEAKRELSFSNKSIKEVAYALGYNNPFYFSRIFKKRVGYSPEEFRQQFAQ